MRVGAHASIAGGVDNAVAAQREYGGTCGQLFTTSPQVWAMPDVDPDACERFRTASADHDIAPWIVHATYLVNLATPDPDLRERSIERLQADLSMADRLDVSFVNVHLGAHTGAGVEAGLENAVTAIDSLSVPTGVQLLVETDAGAGTKLGGDFEHLGQVLEASQHDLGVCFDTAHAFAAGYDLSTRAAVGETLVDFDAAVGFEHLVAVHCNDSKHGCGTTKDEHAHLGEGKIGVDGLRAFLTHDAIRGLPVVCETPTEDGRSFPWNIERARKLAGLTE
jgi:deoxyribonuclease-4